MKCLTSLKPGCICWIGRKAASDIVTSHPSISSKHCSLLLEPSPASTQSQSHDDAPLIQDGNIKMEVKKEQDSPRSPNCTITDHSSNGTWLLQKKRMVQPKRLRRGRPTKIRPGDIIYLLSPFHADSLGYRYGLTGGPRRGEIVVCKLDEEPKTDNCDKLNEAIKSNEINQESSIKKLSSQSLMPQPVLGKKRRDESDEGIIKTKAKVLHSLDVKEDETKEEEEKEEYKNISLEDFEKCPLCLNDFPLSILIEHVDNCVDVSGTSEPTPTHDLTTHSEHKPVELAQCLYCAEDYPLTELVLHVESCDKKKVHEREIEHAAGTAVSLSPEPLEKCIKCFQDFPLSQLITHSASCTGAILGDNNERFKDFVPSVYDVDALTLVVLSPVQQRAVNYVQEVSRKAAYEEYPNLCDRVIKLGYTPKDLQKVLHWVRSSAPIIIHINLDRVLSHLTKDTHYRNLFEIGTGCGSTDKTARTGWEDNIFNKIYHSSPPPERVKYGVLNIVGDPQGVRCCYSYGDSFLQLKRVRLRTTFASMDTSSSRVKLSCCEHYGNVLNEYSDNELKAILDVATHRKPYLQSNIITHYKEVQIHGPVSLSENVDCIVVNSRHRGDKNIEKLLDTFIERNNCNLIWMNPDEPARPSTGTATAIFGGFYGGTVYPGDTKSYEYESDEYGYDESDPYSNEDDDEYYSNDDYYYYD